MRHELGIVALVLAIACLAWIPEGYLPGPGRDAALKCYTTTEDGQQVLDCYYNPGPPPMKYPTRRDPRGARAAEGPSPVPIGGAPSLPPPSSAAPELRDEHDRLIEQIPAGPTLAPLTGGGTRVAPEGPIDYTPYTRATLAPAPPALPLPLAPTPAPLLASAVPVDTFAPTTPSPVMAATRLASA